jgi:hypothetical protein
VSDEPSGHYNGSGRVVRAARHCAKLEAAAGGCRPGLPAGRRPGPGAGPAAATVTVTARPEWASLTRSDSADSESEGGKTQPAAGAAAMDSEVLVLLGCPSHGHWQPELLVANFASA